MRTLRMVVVLGALLGTLGQASGADEPKREPSAFVGKVLPALEVGAGLWGSDLRHPAAAALEGKLVLVVTNAFL